MANIRANLKNGKPVSFRFITCLDRDIRGKQIRRYTTWTPPDGLTPAKAKKAAERAADAWEQEVKAEYQKEKEQCFNLGFIKPSPGGGWMAEGQTGEGKTAQTLAFSFESDQNLSIFPSSAPVYELGHLPPGEG